MSQVETCHIPVMIKEVLEALRAENGGVFLDCTLGGGGHSQAILEANPENFVFACDRDERAIQRTTRRLEPFRARIEISHSAFSRIKTAVGERKFDGILIDLGISTDQLHENRGFSFNDDAPLDMRMDESEGITAHEIINKWDISELIRLFKAGGAVKEARTIATEIVRCRPIESTKEFARIVNKSVARLSHKRDINPATVVFQAVRIAVNAEYDELSAFLSDAPSMVLDGGRLACISFHSGEDKIVAHTLREWESGDTAPASARITSWRGVPRKSSIGRLLTKKAIIPSEEEMAVNPSSRSARLRVCEFRGGAEL